MKLRSVCIATVCFCLTVTSLSPFASAQQTKAQQSSPVPEGSIQYDLFVRSADETTEFFRELRQSLNRSAFDMSALLDELNYDSSDIIKFVKTEIAFEQYRGVLRGSKGTIWSRAGNAVDQAILLAYLLKDAGYDARIARSKINSEAAEAVLKVIGKPAPNYPAFADPDEMMSTLMHFGMIDSQLTESQIQDFRDFVESSGNPEKATVSSLVRSTSEELLHILRSSSADFESDELHDGLLIEAQDYYWVEYRETATDQWTDIHPIFAGDIPFEAPAPSEYFADTVPKNLQHRLRFQVFIERLAGKQLEASPISEPWERPIANMIGTPLTFANLPSEALNRDSIRKDLDEILEASTFFVPIIGGGLTGEVKYFDTAGNVIDPFAANAPGAALFATVNEKFGNALGGLGGDSIVPTLTAQWIELTLIEPGGNEKTFRRMTFDRIGASARQDQGLLDGVGRIETTDARSLVQMHTITVASSKTPRGYVVESGITRLERARPGIDTLVKLGSEDSVDLSPISDIDTSWSGHLAMFAVFDIAHNMGMNVHAYRSGPSLAIHRTGLGQNGGKIEAIDIVTNPRRAFDLQSSIPQIDPEVVMAAGIWDTATEQSFLSRGPNQVHNTWTAFEAAQEMGSKPVLLAPNSSDLPRQLAPDVRVAIQRDLSDGYAVLLPQADMDAVSAGWWRIDLQSGETVGQIRDGRGSTLQEWLTVFGIVISGTALGVSISNCDQTQSNLRSFACCSIGNTVVTLFTFAIGALGFFGEGLLGFVLGAGADYASYQLPIAQQCETAYTPPPMGPYSPPTITAAP